mgnify:CR=1 FL=1
MMIRKPSGDSSPSRTSPSRWRNTPILMAGLGRYSWWSRAGSMVSVGGVTMGAGVFCAVACCAKTQQHNRKLRIIWGFIGAFLRGDGFVFFGCVVCWWCFVVVVSFCLCCVTTSGF